MQRDRLLQQVLNLMKLLICYQSFLILSCQEVQGFPSTLQTGTFDRTSYVVASGLSNNVSKLHEYLYGEKNYVPTENVNSVDLCSNFKNRN